MCTHEPQKPAFQANVNSPSSWQPTSVRLPIYTCSKGKRVSQTPQLTSTAKLRPGNTPTAESGPSSHSTWLTQTCHRTASPRHPPPKTLRFSLCILGSTAVTGNTKKKKKRQDLVGERSTGSLVAPEALCNLHLSVSSPTSFSHTTGIPFEPEEPTERAVPCFLLPQFLESLLRLLTSLPAGGLEETKPPTRPGCFICTELQPAARASGLLWKCSHPTLLPDTLRPTVSSTHLTECLLS